MSVAALGNTLVVDTRRPAGRAAEQEPWLLVQAGVGRQEVVLEPYRYTGLAPPADAVVVVAEQDLVLLLPGAVVGLVEAELEGTVVHGALSTFVELPGAKELSGHGPT